MLNIAIIGSNGQVGCEVAFCLSLMDNITTTCFVRSAYSSFLFRQANIKSVAADFGKVQDLHADLSGFDLVADFSYPSGELPDFQKRISNHVTAVMSRMKRGSKYVHMSSLMAFGMPAGMREIQYFRVPRSSYAVVKRSSEKAVFRSASTNKVEPFCIRLGEVHGVFQSVSQQIRQQLSRGQILVEGEPHEASIAVFASSVAHALVQIGNGTVVSGTHSLTANPQWTLMEVYDFYQSKLQSPSDVRFIGCHRPTIRQSIRQTLLHVLMPYRFWLDAGVLMHHPKLFAKAKGTYRKLIATSRIPDLLPSAVRQAVLVGTVADKMSGILSDRITVEKTLASIKAQLDHYLTCAKFKENR